MNTNLKKILIILIVILIVALVIILVYNNFIKEPSDGEGSPGGSQFPEGKEGNGQQPIGENGGNGTAIPNPAIKIKAISTEKVLAPTLSSDSTKVIYYSQYNGNLWQSDFDGSSLTKMSSTPLNNLINVIWSPDKTKVISIYQDEENNISKQIYNFSNGQLSGLSSYIQEVTWSPSSEKIVYHYKNTTSGENNISTANTDGSGWNNIFQLRMSDVLLDWVGSEISFYEKPSGLTQSSLFLLNPLNGSLNKVISDKEGFSIKWSPQADKVLYSKTSASGKNIGLYVALKNGAGETSLNISGLVEKCVWSKDNRTLFCAIPKNIDEAQTLPDDFYKGTFISDDEFWKINLETGEKTVLLEPWEKGNKIYDAVDLFLSPLEDYLFFVNKINGLLYSIKL